MDVTPLVPEGRQVVHAYRAGGFSVAGQVWEGSVLVTPERTWSWPVGTLAAADLDSLKPLLEAEPRIEVLVLGTGDRFALAPPALRAALRPLGIVVEAMATPAACRTYNILMIEDRRVAAALLAVGQPAGG